MPKHKHNWLGMGFDRAVCRECGKHSTFKRIDAAVKAAYTARWVRAIRRHEEIQAARQAQ